MSMSHIWRRCRARPWTLSASAPPRSPTTHPPWSLLPPPHIRAQRTVAEPGKQRMQWGEVGQFTDSQFTIHNSQFTGPVSLLLSQRKREGRPRQ